MRWVIAIAGFVLTVAAYKAMADELFNRPPDLSRARLESLVERSVAVAEGLERVELFVHDAFLYSAGITPNMAVKSLTNEMAYRATIALDFPGEENDYSRLLHEQNDRAEDLAANVAASANSLKHEFQPPTFQCLAAFYECKAFLASQGEGPFGAEFGCGLTYLFCMAERVIPLAGG
jgi:hypothetical protein